MGISKAHGPLNKKKKKGHDIQHLLRFLIFGLLRWAYRFVPPEVYTARQIIQNPRIISRQDFYNCVYSHSRSWARRDAKLCLVRRQVLTNRVKFLGRYGNRSCNVHANYMQRELRSGCWRWNVLLPRSVKDDYVHYIKLWNLCILVWHYVIRCLLVQTFHSFVAFTFGDSLSFQ